jgi:hypothetical protein
MLNIENSKNTPPKGQILSEHIMTCVIATDNICLLWGYFINMITLRLYVLSRYIAYLRLRLIGFNKFFIWQWADYVEE